MQTNETSFLNKLIDSIKSIEKYPIMAITSFKDVLKYFTILLIIFSIIIACIQTFIVKRNIDDGIEYLYTQFPDLSFKDNQLYVDSVDEINIKANSLIDRIIVNTNNIEKEEKEKYLKEIEKDNIALVFLNKSVIFKTNIQTMEYEYERFQMNSFEKKDIIEYFSGINLLKIYLSIFLICFISTFFVYFLEITMDILSLAFIGYLTAILLRLRLKIIPLIKMSIYAFTLPIVLRLIYVIEQNIFRI